MLELKPGNPPPAAPPQSAAERLAEGRRQLRLFDVEGYQEAVPLFREALEADPSCAAAHAGLAETYAYWGFRREITGFASQLLYNMAAECAAAALKLGPDLGEAHRAMAVALRRGTQRDPERRQREAEAAVMLDATQPESWQELWHAGGYELEAPALRRALALEPRLCSLHIDLGAVYCERQRYPDSLRELTAALQLNPRNSLAHYDAAMVLDRMGERLKAQELLRKALRLHPDEPLIEDGLELLGR